MTRIFTIIDIFLFLLSLFVKTTMALIYSCNSSFCCVVTSFILLFTLSVLLSYRCVQISNLRNPFILDDLHQKSNFVYNELSNNTVLSVLDSQRLPVTVHYMWCRKSHFEYKHYLAVMSVAKVLRPDQIVFHYLEMPFTDEKGYFTWFEDIQREIAMLTLKRIHRVRYCSHDFPSTVTRDIDFPGFSGVFMTDDIAITGLSRTQVHQYLVTSKCSKTRACEVRRTDDNFQLFLVPESEPYSLETNEGRVVLQCPTITVFDKGNATMCVQLNQRLFPLDVWSRNTRFDTFAREIAYGSQIPLIPPKMVDYAVPKIAHILWLGAETTLDPLCYSSIKSAFVVGKLEYVILHGAAPAEGPLWEKLLEQYPITYVHSPELHETSSVQQQLLYGMQALLQHGGMLTTCDVIFQFPVEPLLHFPVVSSVQKSIYRIIHHHIDFSILIAHPGSTFLKSFVPVLKQMSEAGSQRDVGAVGYHTYEQFPASVNIDVNLCSHQMCTQSRCKYSPAETNPRQAYAFKMHFGSARPDTLQQLQSLSPDLLHIYQQMF